MKLVKLKKIRRTKAAKKFREALTNAMENQRITGFAIVAWDANRACFSSWYCDAKIPPHMVPEIARNMLHENVANSTMSIMDIN